MTESILSQGIVALVILALALLVGFALVALYVMIGEPK